MKNKGMVRTMVILSICLLIVHIHAQEAIQVAGLFSDAISLGCGSAQGVKVGATGRVYLQEMVGGKMWPIYIAKFRVTSVDANNCRAKVLEKTRDIAIGHFIAFDKPLAPPAAKPAPVAEPKAEKPQVKPVSAAPIKTYALTIETLPEDVVIYVNGKKSGRGPLKLNLFSPECSVRVEREGYASIEDSFTIDEGGISKSYELKPLAGAAPAAAAKPVSEKKMEAGKYPVRIEVEPADAEITINGHTKGRSPMELTLNAPYCQVSISRKGYETQNDSFYVTEEGMTKKYALKPQLNVQLSGSQIKVPVESSNNPNLDKINKEISRAKSNRTWGTVLTYLFGAGTVFMGITILMYDNERGLWRGGILYLSGGPTIIISAGSVLLTTYGIVLWMKGKKQLNRLKNEKENLKLGLDIRPNMKHYGVSLSLVF